MKTMLVTGAVGAIGAATSLLAAKLGYAAVIHYNTRKKAAEQIAAEIQWNGGMAIAVQADISKEAEVKSLFDAAGHFTGRLDVLVNNAAILEQQTTMGGIDNERLQRIFAVNVFGLFHCSREAVKKMAYSHGGNGGSIVNVSSLAAKTGAPGEYIDYAASKGAVDTLTAGFARELAAEGIRVNGVRPAFIHSGIHAAGGEPRRIERLKKYIPMQRGGWPEEVAAAILWLASERSSYCTGTVIDISGGASVLQ